MHEKTRARQLPVALQHRATPRSGGRPLRDLAGGRRGRTATIALMALGLLASACSTGTESSPDAVSPSFARTSGSGLTYEEPVANVADLIAPPAGDEEGVGWTIVGSVFDPERTVAQAAVWTSDDGRGWEPSLVPPASGDAGESMAAAVRTDDGLLAVGQAGDGEAADAAVWRQEGDDWRREVPEAMTGDHEQWAFEVVAGESGLLVAGGENVWGEVRPRLWFSPDGEEWTSVDGGAGGPLDATGEESLRDIAAVGAGFVAVGSRTVESEQDGVVWYSPDGETWEEVEAPTLGGDGRQDVMTVTVVDGAVVAGGYATDGRGQGQPMIWRSADGVSWGERKRLEMPSGRAAASDQAVRSITAAPQGLIAAGGSDWRPAVWHSTDAGVTWNTLPNPVHGELYQDGVSLRDAEGDGTVTLALGAEPTVMMLAGSRWEDATGDDFPTGGQRPFATAVADNGDVTIAAGGLFTAASGDTRERFVGHVWRETGDGWRPIETETLTAGHINDVEPFAGGFVAVGLEDFGVAEKREMIGNEGQPNGIVWVSENGEDWGRIGVQDARIDEQNLEFIENPTAEMAADIAALEAEAPPVSVGPAGGEGTRSLAAVAPFQDGFIAVGSAYSRGDAEPIVLVSGDGRSYQGEDPAHTGSGDQRYLDVCVGPDGTALAVGITGTTGAHDAIVATRAEGAGWVAAEGPFTGDGDQQALACAAGDEGFVVVGSDDSNGNVDARIWTSGDGVEWTEIESGLLGGTGDQSASAAAAVPDGGWLVAGTDTSAGDGDIALWRVDGGDVERRDRDEPALSGPGEQSVSSVTIDADGRVVLAGNDYGRVGLWVSDTVDR